MKEALFKFEILNDLLIGFTTPGPVPNALWVEYLKHLNNPAIKKYIGGVVGLAEPNSLQRKSAAEAFKARKIPVVIITETTLVRGFVTAASWLGANAQSFDWPELRRGLDHLKVTGVQQDRAVEILLRMKASYMR